MLMDNILDYCNNAYKGRSGGSVCCECDEDCTHPFECSGSCEVCLEQVHFPGKYGTGRLDYECDNILNFYVCKYMHKYASEIEYALNAVDKLPYMDNLSILSLGCGASPDLVAFENYVGRNGFEFPVKYLGIDVNKRWKPINDVILAYFKGSDIDVNYLYEDVIDIFKDHYANEMNVLVLQYLISHFYNTGRLTEVRKFYKRLIKNVIVHMQKRSIIIINDVNSNNRGRDYFLLFSDLLDEKGIKHKCTKRYFNYNIKNVYQQYGIMYPNNNILTWPKHDLAQYNPWTVCSSAQLIIELEVD